MDEKIVSDCAKKTFTLPANGSFFDFAPDSPAEKGTKNLLLLTLSTISPNPRKGIAMLSTDQTEVPEEYYYQLEPVPYMLMHQFAEKNNGEKLDGILMICSPATLDDTVELTDPRYGDFKDTARNSHSPHPHLRKNISRHCPTKRSVQISAVKKLIR